MRGKSTKILAVAGLFAILAVPSVQAAEITATIPFDFTVHNTALPAGEYMAKQVAGQVGLILVQDAARKNAVFINTIGVSSKNSTETPKFVFRRYGEKHVLGQIWMGADDSGRELIKTKLELELAKGSSTSKEKVAIAARVR